MSKERSETIQGAGVSVVIPTLNAGPYLADVLTAISRQKPCPPDEVIIIDSQSTDNTREIAKGFPRTRIETITNFSHGRARNIGIELAGGGFVVFMSQDAVPCDDHWLCDLLEPFSDPTVAAAFSRQIPRPEANPMEQFFLATHFPSGDPVYMRRNGNEDPMFQRDVFFSNVSSAARRDVLLRHPFDETIIMSEDQQFARDIILAGRSVVYVPTSLVVHSHSYSFKGAVGRYFDSVYSLRQVFPKHSLALSVRIGVGYLAKESAMMVRRHKAMLAQYSGYVLAKSIGTLLGHMAEHLPASLCRRVSMHSYFWDGDGDEGRTG